MSADYNALKSELALPEYSGLSAADAAAHYNAKTVSAARDVPLADFERYLLDSGLYALLVARMKDVSPADAMAIAAAQTVLDDVRYLKVDPVKVTSTAFQTGLAALVAIGDVSTQNVADIQALATLITPYYATTGQWGSPITAAQVNYARSLS